MVEIQSRESWTARSPKHDPVTTVVVELYLHHSVGSGTRDKDADGDKGDDYMNQMQWDHMFGTHDWNDIAYNHAYDPDSRGFYEGRGFGIRPGAQKGHNTGTHALVIMGDFRTRPVTDQMKQDIAAFYRDSMEAGQLPKTAVGGHRDAPGSEGTVCPGDNLYEALTEINNLIQEKEMKEKVHWWAEKAFEWAIKRGLYTEASSVADVRETYDFQRIIVFKHRFWKKIIRPAISGAGATTAAVIAEIVARLT